MPTARHQFPKSHRLGGQLQFAAVRESGLKDSRGPLTLRARANDLGFCRLGISIGRHCGTAVIRNRIKRLLREAFRLRPRDLLPEGAGYDLVVSVRRHEPLKLAEYQQIIHAGLTKLHTLCQRALKA